MPELPEVETVARGLSLRMEGKRLKTLDLHRPDLRRPMPTGLKALVEGRVILGIARRAKYVLMHLSDGGTLIVHLGMSGRMLLSDPGVPPTALEKHDHVVFTLEDGTVVRFNDARRFGLLDYAAPGQLADHRVFEGLGPEPLGNEFSGPVLAEALAGKSTPLKAALLDQRVVAGIGNIYACESLYLAGISPKRKAGTVAGARAAALVPAIRKVLKQAIAAGGSSLRDHVQPSGELGYFQHAWKVYGREGESCACGTRKGVVKRIVQGGRSTFFCPECQT